MSKAMKKVIAVAAISLACSAPAWAVWKVNQHGVAGVSSEQDYSMSFYNPMKKVIYLTDVSGKYDTCDNGGKETLFVDGQLVKFITFASNRYCYYFPATIKGNAFIMNEFKSRNYVQWGDHKLSAVGFSSAVKKANESVKNAI